MVDAYNLLNGSHGFLLNSKSASRVDPFLGRSSSNYFHKQSDSTTQHLPYLVIPYKPFANKDMTWLRNETCPK
ncbi:hypothetical protein L1887_07875 [Cichorium endivia]|nr:hypothetical protein L1887_07875 [Cichorium endivia]